MVMTAQLLDGKKIAEPLRQQLAKRIEQHVAQGQRPPHLVVILIGNNPASQLYVSNKQRACKAIGMQSTLHNLPMTVSQTQLVELIEQLNTDNTVDGILLQLPLPEQIDTDSILEKINPYKDVDGFHPYNLGRLAQRHPLLRPCTPYGIIQLLEHSGVPIEEKNAVVVGASNIVGRPMALELLLQKCTVTICHRFTRHLEEHVANAELLIVAVGKPNIIQSDWLKPGVIVVDVGINHLPDGKMIGDIDFTSAAQKASWITPVPGGVGPMTVTMLLENTLLAAQLNGSKMR